MITSSASVVSQGTVSGFLYSLVDVFRNFDQERVLPRPAHKNPFTEDSRSLVGVARAGDVGEMVRGALDLIGGLDKLDVAGQWVLVKPNVNSDDPPPATTSPEVVRAVVELLFEHGADRVVVGDMAGVLWLPTSRTIQSVAQAAQQAGAEVICFEDVEWVKVSIPDAVYRDSISIPRIVHEAPILVNLPAIKSHRIGIFSMSLKNLFGIIHPRDRYRFHASRAIEELIAEISLAAKPDLIIMDGTKALLSGGPVKGEIGDTDLIIASGDPVANDVVGLSVLRGFGRSDLDDPWELGQIKHAVGLGLGAKSWDDILIKAMPDELADQLVTGARFF